MSERAWSEKVSPEALDQYSYSPAWALRMDVASHPYTSIATLTRLAIDTHIFVREAVLENPNTPPLVKMWLRSDYNQSMTLQEFLEASK